MKTKFKKITMVGLTALLAGSLSVAQSDLPKVEEASNSWTSSPSTVQAASSNQSVSSNASSSNFTVSQDPALDMAQRLSIVEQSLNNFNQMNFPGQITQLEQEIQQLRGQFEVLEHKLHRLQTQQKQAQILDESGNIIIDESGNPVMEYVFDDSGNPVMEGVTDESGNPVMVEEKDGSGNIIKVTVYDESGNPITYISSISNSARTLFTPNVDLIESKESSAGYLRLWKRAYRTKGLPQRNVIPQPRIHKVAQRSGTNVLDLDFEIIDSDDTNATVGIMAYAENARVVPQAWTDGTGSKIGTPIATNEVHRVSWDVKQDWNTSTGTLKFEILCQDGRTYKPVDIHFLTLPLADGNLTISRSPIKDADIENYLKYLVATGSNEVAYENSTITDGNGTIYLSSSKQATAQGKSLFMTKLGHRWATATEVNNAKVAATPGTTNVWAASRQVSPRNLPLNVNEYGFDTGNHGTRAWWVVKQ